MTTEELIKALREKTSRDNRALFDEAASRLEELNERVCGKKLKETSHHCECGQALDWEE